MKTKNLLKLFLLIGSFFLYSQLLSAQQSTDTTLTFATRQIYENPNLAIETAQGLIDSEETTIDVKVQALIIVSTAYSSKRAYEKSLEYSLKAIEILPNITDIQLKINLLNRIGGQYQELNVYDKALTYLDEAYKLLKTLPESNHKSQGLGFNYLVRGFIYREQMSCEIALDYFNNSIEAYEKIAERTQLNSNLSIAYYNKGNCLLNIDKINEAEENFLEAITYAKKNNAKSLIAFAQKGLASIYTVKGEYTKAINLLEEALENSEEVGDKILNRSIYNALATNYLTVSDLKNYSFYQNKSQNIHKEIINTERKTIDTSIQNLMDDNSKKIEVYQNTQTTLQAILIALIILVIAFTIRLIFSSEKTLKSLRKELKF